MKRVTKINEIWGYEGLLRNPAGKKPFLNNPEKPPGQWPSKGEKGLLNCSVGETCVREVGGRQGGSD